VSCIACALCGIIFLSLSNQRGSEKQQKKKKTEKKDTAETARKKTPAANIEAFLFEAFTLIEKETEADAISMASLHSRTGKADKFYIMKNGTFIKTKTSREFAADSRGEILRELSRGSHILRDRSRRVLIPLVINETLCAAIIVARAKKITGKEIARIKELLSGIESYF
ncbi:MAG: hypothetical protein ACRCUT_03925, partial [Spirochaetota bacterium]